jgi:conjugal transfer mating pair stabilization protein TraG
MFEIYTFWNHSSMVSVLNGIVLVMGGDDWVGLMKSVVTLGFLIALGVGLLKISVREPLQYFLIVAIVHGILFVPKVTVSVRDARSGQVGTVANVPLGVAFIASTTSQISKFLTDTFETNLVSTDELRFSRTGLAWGANSMATMAAARSPNPRLQDAAQAFVRNCVSPEVSADMDKYTALINSQDVMGLMATGRGTAGGWLNPGRVATMPLVSGSGSEVLPCISASAPGSAYDRLAALIDAEVPTARSGIAARLLPDIAPATANTLVGTYLPGIEGALIGGSRNITSMLTQAIAVNLVSDSAGSLAMVRNDPAAAQMAIGSTIANAQAASSYRMLGMIGAEALPKFRNVLEILLIAIFPLALLMALLGGDRGVAAVRTYALALGSVQLWAPIYAIVNTVLTPMTAARMKAMAGGSISQTMANSEGFIQVGLTEQAIAGALVMAVPMIAWAIVSGGAQAVGGAMGSIMSPSSQAAGAVGASTAMGSMQMGNTSFGNHSLNTVTGSKFDTSPSFSSGRISVTSGLSHSNFGGDDGARVVNNSAQRAEMGPWTATMGARAASSLTAQAGVAAERAREAAQAFTSSAGQAYQSFVRNGAGSTTGSTLSAGAATNSSAQQGGSYQSGISQIRALAARHGISEEQAFSAALAAHMGLSLPGKSFSPVTGGADINAQTSSGGRNTKLNEEAAQVGQSSDFKSLVQSMRQGQVGNSATNTAEAKQSRESGGDASLRQATEAADQYRVASRQSENLSQTAQRAASRDQSFISDLGNSVDAWLRSNNRPSLEALGRMATTPVPSNQNDAAYGRAMHTRAQADAHIAEAVTAVLSQRAGEGGFTITPASAPAQQAAPLAVAHSTQNAGEGRESTGSQGSPPGGSAPTTGAGGGAPGTGLPNSSSTPESGPATRPLSMPSLSGLPMPSGMDGTPMSPAAIQEGAGSAGARAQAAVDGGNAAVAKAHESAAAQLQQPLTAGGLSVRDGAGNVITGAGVWREANTRLGDAQSTVAGGASGLAGATGAAAQTHSDARSRGENPASYGLEHAGRALGQGATVVTDPIVRTWKRLGGSKGSGNDSHGDAPMP